MTFSETFKIAIRSLMANKLRSALTMLGIIIGVASVVTMIAVGAGASNQIQDQIRSLGANVLMINPEAARRDGVHRQGASQRALIDADARAIEAQLATVSHSVSSVRRSYQLIAGNRNWWTSVNGTQTGYFAIREWPLEAGRSFSAQEQQAGEKIILIGQTVAKQLFGSPAAALDRTIRILNSNFTVIGVLAAKGPSGFGSDQDDVVFMPLQTLRQRLLGGANQVNRDAVDYLLAKAVSEDAIAPARHEITALLRARHGLRPGMEDDFSVTVPAASMEAQNASARVFAWLLASIASVSLVVGGISIMNIMLVSVSERRREIGLRMALGARKRHVLRQFLIEAVLLCLFGGVIGLLIGLGATVLVAHFAQWPVYLSPGTMALSLLVSAGVGVFFGYYPARRAASEDPIQCLRTE
ncbi:ABC transporter permease [Thalassovita mangrovi]|uniref:FtsX-like permease family protein n=1 Tax=Thalassovita mangrovi TaxID=2692236 RepID=A0A6L8LI54_9RHOB|nr:ABC transporter permease [Thalassovita mangrovi]MYM54090.1 FtsX-like permease family protein [Thalassovita mangrovi]